MNEKILVFIPMYNCAQQIERVLAQFTSEVQNIVSEIIIVDNGSSDGSREVAGEAIKKLGIKASVFLNEDNYNLGGSHKVAFNYAKKYKFDYVIVLHGDDQGSISDMIQHIRQGEHRKYDCLLGARFMKGSQLKGYSQKRIWGNRCFNAMASIITFRRIYDLGSGLNIYSVKSLQGDYYLRFPNSLIFNEYMLLHYIYYKKSILFVPITWRESDQISNAKLISVAKGIFMVLAGYFMNRKKLLAANRKNEKDIIYHSKIQHSNRMEL